MPPDMSNPIVQNKKAQKSDITKLLSDYIWLGLQLNQIQCKKSYLQHKLFSKMSKITVHEIYDHSVIMVSTEILLF